MPDFIIFHALVLSGPVTGARPTRLCTVLQLTLTRLQAQKRAAADEERRRVHKSALSARRSSSVASGDSLPTPGPGASSGGGGAAGAWPLAPWTRSQRSLGRLAAHARP